MEKERIFVEAKNQQGNIEIIKSDLLNILTLPETGMLWEKQEREYIFFSKEKWSRFVSKMQKAKWDSLDEIIKEIGAQDVMDRFNIGLIKRCTTVDIKEKILIMDRYGPKKNIPEGVLRIEICI